MRVPSAAASNAFACSSEKLLDGRPVRPCGGCTRAATLRPTRSLAWACRIARSSEVAGDLQGPGGVAGCELAQGRPHIARAEAPQRPAADDLQHRLQQALVQPAGPLGSAVQPLTQPVLHRTAHRVPGRRPDPGIQLGVQRLELVPDLLLGPAGDLPPVSACHQGRSRARRPRHTGSSPTRSRSRPRRDPGA